MTRLQVYFPPTPSPPTKTLCSAIHLLPGQTSSIVTEAIGTVLFFYERYFKCKKHKQKHLSNIQPNISISKKHLSNIQPNIFKQKKHLSNIIQTIYTKTTSRYVLKHLKKLV